MRVLKAWRARFAGKTAVQGIAEVPDGEVVFETWAGGWVEEGRAGMALTGILREAGIPDDRIRALLVQALETMDNPEDSDETLP